MMTEQLMREDLLRTPPEGLQPLIEKLRQRFGPALKAVVLYGSCRRIDDTGEGLVDLMVLVSGYSQAHGFGLSALLNRLLPPNVYYLEACSILGDSAVGQNPGNATQRIRCKFIVMTQAQFSRRCRRGLDGYFWARFSQPCRLVWAANDALADEIAADRANAAGLFARRAARLGEETLTAEQFWVRALKATYGSELRPEPPGAAARLVAHDLNFWNTLSARLLVEVPFVSDKHPEDQSDSRQYTIRLSTRQRIIGRLDWSARRVWSKCLNVLRLLKAAGTFANGLDYLVWKVERHSGVRVEPTERMRRHPRIAAWGLVLRLWREGTFR